MKNRTLSLILSDKQKDIIPIDKVQNLFEIL